MLAFSKFGFALGDWETFSFGSTQRLFASAETETTICFIVVDIFIPAPLMSRCVV